MEDSILKSTKKILGLDSEYTAFDLDIITHINSVFSILSQLGLGPAGFQIEDDSKDWADFIASVDGINMVKSYVFMKVRMMFDPPATSFAIDAINKQIQEMEWRLNTQIEWLKDPHDPMAVEEV